MRGVVGVKMGIPEKCWNSMHFSECASIILDIKCMALRFSISFNFIPHSFNVIAHWVVREALRGSLRPDWISSPPMGLSDLVSIFGY